MKYASVFPCTVALFVLTYASFGQTWEVEYETPDIRNTHDVEYVTDSVFVVVGENGLLARTEDGGSSWHQVDSQVYSTIRRVRFLDENHGWAVGEGGVIIHSADGGQTWELQESNVDETLRGVAFTDEMNGWVVGWYGEVLHTTDGGRNWAEFDLYPELPPTSQPDLLNIDFYDSQHGWIVGEVCFRTTDGGETWEAFSSNAEWLSGVQALSENTIVACGNSGKILRIVGENINFTTLEIQSLRDIEFVDDMEGYVVGDVGIVGKTMDGGLSWQIVDAGASNLRLNGVAFADPQQAIIGGLSYSLYRTTELGQEWESVSPGVPPQFNSVSFANQELGFCLNEQDELLKTTNGGVNWFLHPFSATFGLYCLRFSSETDLWIVGAQGAVYHSEDAGESWNTVIVPANGGLRDIAFFGTHIWMTGDNGTVIHSADNGEHWETQNVGISSWLSGIDFIDESNGVLVGGYSRIYFTEDGGAHWTQSDFVNDINLRDVDFIDAETISCVGEYGNVFMSYNRGATWERYLQDTNVNYYSVEFIDRWNGWTIGTQGTILRTEDGGETWTRQEIAPRGGLRDICLESPYAWIVGGGVILRSDIPSSSDNQWNKIVTDYSLSAYPNPFNSTTTLTFDIPQAGRVSLNVFDITGRLVTTLQDRVTLAGTYSVPFEGTSLSSGIYFVSLKGNTVSTTKKIVLLK
ncbi:T9SS type A sorting domain-containing protein [bacterium]|nr:T9SS type A sorting domain-containing protein [bacterium]MBU1637698.1 T9SS type A sorting domain-containing protein [bacterium]MBU1920326.1 T9SS type A sorting domain-containing protein [bacterium]